MVGGMLSSTATVSILATSGLEPHPTINIDAPAIRPAKNLFI